MSRRVSKGGKLNKKSIKDDDSDFSDDLDFSLDLESQKNIGKRTGKVFNQKNWKKNSDGFYDIPLQQDNSLTPQTKIAQLKQFLGLHRQEEQSNMNKNSVEQDQEKSRQQAKKNVKKNNRQSMAQRRKSRHTDFSFSFSLDLDDDLDEQLMQASFSSQQQTNLQENFNKIRRQTIKEKQSNQIQPLPKKKKNQLQGEQWLPEKEKKSKQKVKRVSFRDQPELQKKQTKKQQKPQQKKQTKRQSSKIQKKYLISDQQIKPSKTRSSFERKSQKVEIAETKKQSKKIETNFSDKESIKKDFKDISEIQMRQKSIDYSFDDQSLGSFLGQLQNQASNSETGGQLNKAVINTQTENTKEDQSKEFQLGKKVKVMEKQQKQKKKIVKNSQDEPVIQSKKMAEKNPQQEKKNPNPSKKAKESFFLTQSLRKEALYYYEQQRKEEEQKRRLQEQKKKKKQGKRSRQFQVIETDDILDQQKLQEMKQKSEHQKAVKKLKINQPVKASKNSKVQKQQQVQKPQKFQKKNQKDKLKFKQQKKSPKKHEKKSKRQVSKSLEENQFHLDQYEFIPSQQSVQKQKVKVNNRLVKEADKLLKRKQKPQRVSPVQKKGLKKAQTMTIGKNISKEKGQKASRVKTQVDRLMGKNHHNSIIQDSILQSGRKYPKRKRFPRVQGWNGERIVYDANGEAVVESKQLTRLIGLINESSLDTEITLAKKDRYIQRILLMPKQVVDFEGFDDKYIELHIIYVRKSRGHYEKQKKSVEVYQDGDLSYLIEPRIIRANSGNFTIQNNSEDCAYLELVLFKNEEFQI